MISKGIRAFDKIDVLANCAAKVIPNIKFQDLLWTDYLEQIEVNIKSTFTLIQAVVPEMIKNGYGKIINIGSLSAEKPNAEWSHYITAKSALIGLTKSLAFELAPKGIRINMVTPSLVNTEFKNALSGKTLMNCDSACKISDGLLSKTANAFSPFLPARPDS